MDVSKDPFLNVFDLQCPKMYIHTPQQKLGA